MQMQLRKELFLAHSRMWGIRGRVQLRADFIHPSSAKAGWEDIATIRAFIDLVRLRPELRWILPRAKITDERRTTTLGGWYPIDPQAYMAYGAPIMPEYCTAPLPSLQDEPARPLPNTDRFMLADWPVGVRSPVTVVMGEAGDAMTPSWTNDPTFKGESYTRAYTPVELLVMDHFVHKDLFGRLDPTLHVLGDLGPWMPYPVQGELRNEIAVAERVQFLGRGISCATLPAMNNYAQLLAEVCTRQHWNPTDFDVYRVRIEFPPVPCTVSLRYPMPLRDEPINHTGV
jgi:hypothetical protein